MRRRRRSCYSPRAPPSPSCQAPGSLIPECSFLTEHGPTGQDSWKTDGTRKAAVGCCSISWTMTATATARAAHAVRGHLEVEPHVWAKGALLKEEQPILLHSSHQASIEPSLQKKRASQHTAADWVQPFTTSSLQHHFQWPRCGRGCLLSLGKSTYQPWTYFHTDNPLYQWPGSDRPGQPVLTWLDLEVSSTGKGMPQWGPLLVLKILKVYTPGALTLWRMGPASLLPGSLSPK